MSKPNDEFEATRTVVDTLKDFKQPEQQMIFRWAAEKLGLPQPFGSGTSSHLPSRTVTAPPAGPLIRNAGCADATGCGNDTEY